MTLPIFATPQTREIAILRAQLFSACQVSKTSAQKAKKIIDSLQGVTKGQYGNDISRGFRALLTAQIAEKTVAELSAKLNKKIPAGLSNNGAKKNLAMAQHNAATSQAQFIFRKCAPLLLTYRA